MEKYLPTSQCVLGFSLKEETIIQVEEKLEQRCLRGKWEVGSGKRLKRKIQFLLCLFILSKELSVSLSSGFKWKTSLEQKGATMLCICQIEMNKTGSFLDWKYLPELNQVHYKEGRSTSVYDFKRAS